MRDDQIIDAEWEEVPGNAHSKLQQLRVDQHPQDTSSSQKTDNPWRDPNFWRSLSSGVTKGFVGLGAILVTFAIASSLPEQQTPSRSGSQTGQASAAVNAISSEAERRVPEPKLNREDFFDGVFPTEAGGEKVAGDDFCSAQETIDDALPAFQDALTRVMVEELGFDTVLFANMFREDRARPRYKFLNIRPLGIENTGLGKATFRCQADLRVLQEVPNSDGAFSSYVQFNAVHYTAKLRGLNTDSPEAAFLAELNPGGGEWDISQGSE